MRSLRSDPGQPQAEDRPVPEPGPDPGDAPARRRLPGWLVIVVPVLFELFVGGFRITVPSFWRDEGYTITGAQRPVGAIFALVQHQDAFHGLYLLLMHPIIAVFGDSEAALRVPSLIAMCAAVGMTAALGRRLARASGLPAAPVVGLISGLLLAGLPVITRYAQEGRPYALTVLFAVLATYLLIVATERMGWRWWALYGAILLVIGLLDLAAVLLPVTHGIALLAGRHAGRRAGDAAGDRADSRPAGLPAGVLGRWLAACVGAALLLSPVLAFSFRQSSQLDWVQPPNGNTIMGLLQDLSGITALIPVTGVLVVLGCIAGTGLRRGHGVTLAPVCLPWFVLPPTVLLLVSLAHPVYVDRYILYCVPGVVLLVVAGLTWLAVLARRLLARRVSSPRRLMLASLALPAAAAVAIVVLLAGPQAAIRLSYSRADNIRLIASILAQNEQPGDAVLYLPRKTAVISYAYRGPFGQLRDLGLQAGPVASDTLLGVPASPAVVAARLHGVRRVWTIEWTHPLAPDSVPPPGLVKLLTPMHMRASWLIQSILVVLYTAPAH